MKTPLFWYQKLGFRSAMLSPLSHLWIWAGKRRIARTKTERAEVPVICVGNINMGGAGKTPTVIALVQMLTAMGHKPFVVSRGHGGSEIGPHRVKSTDPAAQVGDEPLMIEAFAPVIIAKDRAAGARMAVTEGANCIVLDDGMQNTQLHKDFTIWVVDAFMRFGNGKICPAGPLREGVGSGLSKSDLVIAIGGKGTGFGEALVTGTDVALMNAQIEILETGMDWSEGKYFAFAGIAEPRKFFRSLEFAGANVVGEVGFADHQPYSDLALSRLEREAAAKGAQLVTTEKDAMRLPHAFRSKVVTFPVRLKFDDAEAVWNLIEPVIQSGSQTS